MAAPQQKKVARISINPPTVDHAYKPVQNSSDGAIMLTPPLQVEEVKKRDVLDVYRSILNKATEMYVISLEIESSEELASLLKAVEVVQVQLSVIIGRIQEERAIAKSVKEYEERSVKDEEV
jgi:hypothetical protein